MSTPPSTAQVGPFYRATGVAQLLEVSEREMVGSATADTIIGVQLEDGEWVFPAWQFDNFAIPAALIVLWKALRAGGDRWTCMTWLSAPHPDLDGRTAVEWVVAAVGDGADGQRLDLVLHLARADVQRGVA